MYRVLYCLPVGRVPLVAKKSSLYFHNRSLRELERNYSTIIMPEGVKKFLQGEATVLETGRQVLDLLASTGLPLEEVKHELRYSPLSTP